jgi:hypothetical protein
MLLDDTKRCKTIRYETARAMVIVRVSYPGGRHLMSRKRTRLINIMIMRLLLPRPFMLPVPRFLRVFAVYMTLCALIIHTHTHTHKTQNQPQHNHPTSPAIYRRKQRKQRKGAKRTCKSDPSTQAQASHKRSSAP